MSIQLWEEGAHGGLGSPAPRGAGAPCHLLGRGGKEDVGAKLHMSIGLMFIKLNQISTAFLSREGKSSKRRVAAKNWERR